MIEQAGEGVHLPPISLVLCATVRREWLYPRMSEADMNQVESSILIRQFIEVDPAVRLLAQKVDSQLEPDHQQSNTRFPDKVLPDSDYTHSQLGGMYLLSATYGELRRTCAASPLYPLRELRLYPQL